MISNSYPTYTSHYTSSLSKKIMSIEQLSLGTRCIETQNGPET